ncbi:MAG: hypothetical protein Q4G45_06195 [Actinomycetia bacterium]|nr:hypothetical protein [Actinomycetes bacterium]
MSTADPGFTDDARALSGEVAIFVGSAGKDPAERSELAALLSLLAPEEVETEELSNDGGPPSVFWAYPGAGVELEWQGRRLVSAHLYVQPDEAEGYRAYARPLFDGLPNTATRDQIEARLGAPDTVGEWNGQWIRYDLGSCSVHFELDDDLRARLVTVDAPFE